ASGYTRRMTGPRALPAIPESIGPYRIVRVIGEGGMGVVYLGEHRASSERVAIKTVRLPREGLLSGIRREIHALRSIQHPRVVRVRDQGVAEGIPWYAMELLEGRTLAASLSPPPHPNKAATTEVQPTVAGTDSTTPIVRPQPGDVPRAARPAINFQR